MSHRLTLTCALLIAALFGATASAQPGDRFIIGKSRVLDILFPLDVVQKPYRLKLIMRFGASNSQLVIVVDVDGHAEMTRYALADMKGGEDPQLIATMIPDDPDINVQAISAKLKVNVARLPLEKAALDRALRKLKSIRISPVLSDTMAADGSEYELWYDNWQESVHYTLTSPPKNAPEDKLVRWMNEFRASVGDVVNLTSAPHRPNRH